MSRPQPKGSENPLPDWSSRFIGLECEFVSESETGVIRFILWDAREASKDGTTRWIKADKADITPLSDAV